MKVREIIKKLELDSWVLARTKGSHRQYHHPAKPGTVTVCGQMSAAGWGAYAPDLPGLGVAGATIDDVKQLMREAMEFHLEGMREHGEIAPPPTAQTEYVTVT